MSSAATGLGVAIALAVIAGCSSTATDPQRDAAAEPAQGFTYGVTAGAMNTTTAKLWTRSDVAGPVVATIRQDANFGTSCEQGASGSLWSATQTAQPEMDLTLTFDAAGLEPGQTYRYRFCTTTGDHSVVGTFKTPPSSGANANINFAYTGDYTAETPRGSNSTTPFYNSFDVFSSMAKKSLDFAVLGGDVIYSDSVAGDRKNPTAVTREEKWAKYRENLRQQQLQQLRAATGEYAHWDDHEWDNGFYPTPSNQALFAAGVQAFTDYMPVEHSKDRGIYSTYEWGKNLEVFVLDETSFRTAPVDELKDKPCTNPVTKRTERMPTASKELRARMASLLKEPSLNAPVSAACTDAINKSGRTILGAAQFEQLQRDLRASKATFKVIASTGPMQKFYVAPYGRFEGYPLERRRMLDLFTEVPNVVVLATDVHATLVGQVDEARPTNTAGQAMEVTVGPAAAGTRQVIWNGYFRNVPNATELIASDFFRAAKSDGGLGMSCANLNTYSYATVSVSDKQLVVTPRDQRGDQVTDVLGKPCQPLTVDAGK